MKFQLLIKAKKSCFQTIRCCIIMLINVKMPTIVGILTFMSMINFMLRCVENEESFITSGPDTFILSEEALCQNKEEIIVKMRK